ncbi:hypothetical protein ONZ45_g18734 [Pleurotus djamor]|nr:hypothetical protein ONZ45_g18734 [Pleurotus djamor]
MSSPSHKPTRTLPFTLISPSTSLHSSHLNPSRPPSQSLFPALQNNSKWQCPSLALKPQALEVVVLLQMGWIRDYIHFDGRISMRRRYGVQTAGKEDGQTGISNFSRAVIDEKHEKFDFSSRDAAYRRQAQYHVDPFANSVRGAHDTYEQGDTRAGRRCFEGEEI